MSDNGATKKERTACHDCGATRSVLMCLVRDGLHYHVCRSSKGCYRRRRDATVRKPASSPEAS